MPAAAILRSRSSPIALGAALLAAALLWFVYAPVAEFGFLSWDDRRHIQDNVFLHVLTAENLRWMFTNAEIDYWRPPSFLSHAVDFALFGDDAGAHHVSSVVVHGVNAALVMLLGAGVFRLVAAESVARLPWLAGVVGGLAGIVFAVHPQHVESTAWLAERKELLCAGFYLLAVCCYLRGRGTARGWTWAALACFVAALMSKPMAISLPVVLIALDVYPLGRIHAGQRAGEWLRIALRKWPYVLLAALVGVYTYVSVDSGGYLNDTERLPIDARVVNAARSFWIYPWRWLYPLELSPLYPMTLVDNSLNARTLAYVAGVILVFVTGALAFARGRGTLLGVSTAYLAIVAPVLGLVHSGLQSSADRYAYLPGALFCIGAACALFARLRERAPWPVLLTVFAAVWIAGMATLGERQVHVWRDGATMWRTVKAYYPDFNRYPELARGRSAYANGEFREARALLDKALARRQPAHDVHVYLGLTLQALGDDALAVQHLRTALALAPDSALHWHLAAKGHIQGRRFEEARAAIARQRELAPGDAAPLRQLATLELEASNVDAAREVLDTLLEASPGDVESLVLRGVVSHLLGEVAEARRYYERALAAQPANADARRNLERLGVPVSAAQ